MNACTDGRWAILALLEARCTFYRNLDTFGEPCTSTLANGQRSRLGRSGAGATAGTLHSATERLRPRPGEGWVAMTHERGLLRASGRPRGPV